MTEPPTTFVAPIIHVEWKGGRKDGDKDLFRQQWRVPDGFKVVTADRNGETLMMIVSER